MSVTDISGNFVLVNSAFGRILGWDPHELIGQSYVSYIHPDDLERVASVFEPVDGVAPTFVELELRERCRDESYRWMTWTVHKEGDLYYAVGHDITERKATYDALAASLEKSRAIFDAAVDSIIVIDKNFVVVESSPASDASESFSREEREGRIALEFVHPEDQDVVREAIERAFSDDDVVQVRFRGLQSVDHWVMVESRGRALRDAQGNATGAVIISRNISESVETERALQLAKFEAEQANFAKSEFMSRMSHELRTPLNSVLGFAQILQMELQTPDELEMIGYIVKSGGYLLELINEVLDISRVESGTMAVTLELVAAYELVRECVEVVAGDAVALGVEIIDHCEGEHIVRADPHLLRLVLVNLLSNAIKYNRAGGSVTLTCAVNSGRVRLNVTDTGPGVEPQLHERLFAPFDRLDAEAKGIEGTGLGLALSKGLMEAIGGALGVESEPGAGSTFWAELPLATTSGGFTESSRDQPPMVSSGIAPSATVLYVEDNIGNVRLMERLMAHRPNVRLVTTLRGSLGCELAREHHPDLILLDVHMPDLSGFEVLEQLRGDESTSSIPVVMLSADASQEQIQRFRDVGVLDYLTKPLDLQHFLTQLDKYLQHQVSSIDA